MREGNDLLGREKPVGSSATRIHEQMETCQVGVMSSENYNMIGTLVKVCNICILLPPFAFLPPHSSPLLTHLLHALLAPCIPAPLTFAPPSSPIHYMYSHSLHPCNPHPCTPHSLTPSLPHSLTPSLSHPLTPSLPHFLLPHSLTPSLLHPLTPSPPHSLTAPHRTSALRSQPSNQTLTPCLLSAGPSLLSPTRTHRMTP